MCVYSAISDHMRQTLPPRYPETFPPGMPWGTGQGIGMWDGINRVSRTEFDELKKEVQELRLLLLAAKRFDESTNQCDCEKDEKVALLKKLADLVGVDFSDVLKK